MALRILYTTHIYLKLFIKHIIEQIPICPLRRRSLNGRAIFILVTVTKLLVCTGNGNEITF